MTGVSHVPLGDLMAAKTGSVDPSRHPDEAFDLYSIPSFDQGSAQVALGSAIGSAKQVVQPQDVLLSRIVPHIRRTWVVGEERGRRLIASGEWIVFRSSRVAPAYLRQVLRSDPFHVQYMQTVAGVGGSLLRARPAQVARISIPLPPLSEQRRIAAILDQADTLRAKRREALAELDSLTQSIFIEMFGGQQSQEWPIETIADVAALHDGAIRTGPFGSQLLHSEFVAEGVAVLGIDNAVGNEFRWGERRFISEAKYRDLRRYTVRPGDVLITIMGTCGRCAVVPDDIPVSINTKHLCCITLNAFKCRPEFLHAFFLRHPMARGYLEQTSKGAIMSGLNMGLIRSMPIPVPPLSLQRTFASRIQAVESIRTIHRAALAETDALFASLQHRAFTGGL